VLQIGRGGSSRDDAAQLLILLIESKELRWRTVKAGEQ
jgi:hypothetical protein